MSKRPESLKGITKKVKAACGSVYVTVNEDESGVPIETFIRIGKGGGCAAAQCEAMARLIAWGLRSKADMGELVRQLCGISCHQAEEGKPSCPHAVGLAVERYLTGKASNV